MSKRLENKIALITGAAQGIGAAIATLFHQEGAIVFVTDINDAPGQELSRKLGGQAHYLHLDVTQEADWLAAMAQIQKQYGRLDVLVNNAGITGFEQVFEMHDPEHTSVNAWKRVHSVNLEGVFIGCKYGIQTINIMAAVSSISHPAPGW